MYWVNFCNPMTACRLDVEALRSALGLGKINLLGHSYGGVVAQAYALRFQIPYGTLHK
jgi:pimeloyl-ACP methyl ester carboxylesterase